jgi:ribonuclease BN (tRNA processing enzyme)
MARTLTVLGCDGSYPGPRGAASGYLVSAGATTLWLDAGPGTFAELQVHCDPASLGAVVLSHEHSDHWTDVESLGSWLLCRGGGPVPVYAPAGLAERSAFASQGVFDWHVVEPDEELTVGEITCRFAATDHGPTTLATGLEAIGGSSALVYSADTGAAWSPEVFGAPIGTLLCDATFTRADEGRLRHLSGRQAGAMARAARVDRLVVTHRWPTVSAQALADEASTAFGAAVGQAAPGLTFEW